MEMKIFMSFDHILLFIAILSSVTRTCIGTNETLSSVPPDSNNLTTTTATTPPSSTTLSESINTTVSTEPSVNASTVATTIDTQSTENGSSSTNVTKATETSIQTSTTATTVLPPLNTTESVGNLTEATTLAPETISTTNGTSLSSSSTVSTTSTTFSSTTSFLSSTSSESNTTLTSESPLETESLTNDDPYSNARSAGLSSFFALIILIGLAGYGLWHFRKHQMKEVFYGPSFRQFGSLTLHPTDPSLPQRSTRSFRFAMGPTNNSSFDIRSGDELQRRDNSDTGFGQASSRSRSFENFDPFDPRSHDYESEGQFVNRNDSVMLS